MNAPFYPLKPIQRLAFLDRTLHLQCSKDLWSVFSSSQEYRVRLADVAVKRTGTKPNLEGGIDQVEWHSKELSVILTDGNWQERVFVDERLFSSNVQVNILAPGDRPGRQRDQDLMRCRLDGTFQILLEHFVIPEVLDVAQMDPMGYERNLRQLKEIEDAL